MRVAYVCADPDVPAFAHRAGSFAVREMCVAMLDAGLDVSLFVSSRGGTPPARLAGLPVTDLRPPTAAADPVAQTREAVTLNGDTAMALASSGPFDIIYERAACWSAAPMHFARRHSAVGILELHAPLLRGLAEDQESLHARAARALLKSSLHTARVVIATSDDVASVAQTLADGTANVHVIPGGCDPRCLAQVPGDYGRGSFVVGYVGALRPGLGLETLVDAFATLVATRVPHAQLLIVGDGPMRNELVIRTARRGLADCVTMTTAAADDLPALLAKMHVTVAPHADDSPSPAIFDCMAAGLPVVASSTVAFNSIVGDHQTGMLVAPGDVAGLASALGQLHADPLRLRRLGRKARSYAAGHCTWAKSLERILELAGALSEPLHSR